MLKGDINQVEQDAYLKWRRDLSKYVTIYVILIFI